MIRYRLADGRRRGVCRNSFPYCKPDSVSYSTSWVLGDTHPHLSPLRSSDGPEVIENSLHTSTNSFDPESEKTLDPLFHFCWKPCSKDLNEDCHNLKVRGKFSTDDCKIVDVLLIGDPSWQKRVLVIITVSHDFIVFTDAPRGGNGLFYFLYSGNFQNLWFVTTILIILRPFAPRHE